MEKQVIQAQMASQDHKEHKVNQAIQERMERKVKMAIQEKTENQAIQDHKEVQVRK